METALLAFVRTSMGLPILSLARTARAPEQRAYWYYLLQRFEPDSRLRLQEEIPLRPGGKIHSFGVFVHLFL